MLFSEYFNSLQIFGHLQTLNDHIGQENFCKQIKPANEHSGPPTMSSYVCSINVQRRKSQIIKYCIVSMCILYLKMDRNAVYNGTIP